MPTPSFDLEASVYIDFVVILEAIWSAVNMALIILGGGGVYYV